MRFTIITITYQAERYLAETLRSVAIQEGVDFEHILFDGGSHDRTLAIARSFSHVTVIEGKDEGIADAMNRAAAHAKGDFLLFLHADDLLAHSRSLLMADRVLKQHPHVEWLYGKAHVIDFRGSLLRTTPYEPFSFKRLRKYNFITHPATLVSHSLFKKVGGFHKELRYCMDYDLWLRLASFTTPYALTTPLAAFREHKSSLSTKEPLGVTDESYLVRNRYVTSFPERLRSYRTWKKRRNKLLNTE
jgi:glycosyltransferase involved in cell wall biosynthesis